MKLNIEIAKIDFSTINKILTVIANNTTDENSITVKIVGNSPFYDESGLTLRNDENSAFARYMSTKPSDEE